MPDYTANHGYTNWARGESDWQHNDDMQQLDTDVEVRDTDVNRTSYEPKDGAKYLATDTGTVYLGNGAGWDPLGTIGDTQSTGSDVISSPNGTIQTTMLADGDSTEISVPVADGETLTVMRWGGYSIADGTAPDGLTVDLLDGTDTVQASANTVDTRDANGAESYTNSSGSLSIFKLRVANNTGTDFTVEGVGAIFGYEVA